MPKRILKAILTLIAFSLPLLALILVIVELSGGEYASFDDLHIGQTISVEGKPLGLGGKTILAKEIEIKNRPPKEKLKGRIETIDPQELSLTISGVKILLGPDTLIEARHLQDSAPEEKRKGNAPLYFSVLKQGQRVRVRGKLRDDGAFDADEIQVRNKKTEEEAGVEGELQSIDYARATFTVLGFTIHVNSRAKIEFD